MAQLRPADIFVIQRAIEDYERRFPGRPTPTAEEALAWRLGGKGELKSQTEPKPEPGVFRWILRELSGLLRA